MKRDSKGKFRTRNKCIFRSLYEPGEDKHVIKYHFDDSPLANFCCYCGIAAVNLKFDEWIPFIFGEFR